MQFGGCTTGAMSTFQSLANLAVRVSYISYLDSELRRPKQPEREAPALPARSKAVKATPLEIHS
jgi:hypothetical protein